ncbi:MAG: hypothetical protein OSB76_11780 [Alphaproteobacteria bacterium]|nr:hypothetical protein [Alphaproteobacteria bacterium]
MIDFQVPAGSFEWVGGPDFGGTVPNGLLRRKLSAGAGQNALNFIGYFVAKLIEKGRSVSRLRVIVEPGKCYFAHSVEGKNHVCPSIARTDIGGINLEMSDFSPLSGPVGLQILRTWQPVNAMALKQPVQGRPHQMRKHKLKGV